MIKLLVICFEDKIQTFKYDKGQISCCRYRGNDTISYSNNHQIWSEYWEYILSEYTDMDEDLGVTSIYSEFAFKDAFNIIMPLKEEKVQYFQINSLETILPELVIKKGMLNNSQAIYAAFGNKVWQVGINSQVTLCAESNITPYRFAIEDIVTAYFSYLPTVNNTNVQYHIHNTEKSGDLARYVNTSKIK